MVGKFIFHNSFRKVNGRRKILVDFGMITLTKNSSCWIVPSFEFAGDVCVCQIAVHMNELIFDA